MSDSPYGAPQKEKVKPGGKFHVPGPVKEFAGAMGGLMGHEPNHGYSKNIKSALVGIPETDEKTRMGEFKARYRAISSGPGPGGGTTGPDGEDKPGFGDLDNDGK